MIAGKTNAYVVIKTTIAATRDTKRVKNILILLFLKISLIFSSSLCMSEYPSDLSAVLNDVIYVSNSSIFYSSDFKNTKYEKKSTGESIIASQPQIP